MSIFKPRGTKRRMRTRVAMGGDAFGRVLKRRELEYPQRQYAPATKTTARALLERIMGWSS